MTLTKLSSGAKTLALSAGTQPVGVTYSVAPSQVSLGAGASTTVTVTMRTAPGAAAGHK